MKMAAELTEKVITHFRTKIGLVFWLRHLFFYLTVWCFVWGIAVIAMRSFFHTEKTFLLYGAIGVVPHQLTRLRLWQLKKL